MRRSTDRTAAASSRILRRPDGRRRRRRSIELEAMSADPGGSAPYPLGHSPVELDRLQSQARFIDPVTRNFFREAGLKAGMRVLDVGSGAGDVSFLAAELVGESGRIVGVDRSAAAIDFARARAAAKSLPQVSFRQGEAAAMDFAQPFDAVVGRYVLQFQSDPAA